MKMRGEGFACVVVLSAALVDIACGGDYLFLTAIGMAVVWQIVCNLE